MKRIISIITLVLIFVNVFCGCEKNISDDLMLNITPNNVEKGELSDVDNSSVTDFAVRLFRSSFESGKNVLISPLSVLTALSMTANGADGNTLTQMEATLGMSVQELNGWISTYIDSLPTEEKYKLSLANSIWFTDEDTFTVNDDFLQTNADYYGAGIYRAPFDKSTCRDINNWVSDNTDGMIKNILDEIPESAVMYLVNALAFDAEWQTIYNTKQIRDNVFTTEDGVSCEAEMMYSEENRYLEDDSATGFIKYYNDRKYAFVALLPNDGVTVAEYVASLDGEKLFEILDGAEITPVETAIPKFETEYDVEMSDVLKQMGMTDAFDYATADFSKLGYSVEGNIKINRVLHKTYINVDEKGTKAGAATVVEMDGKSALMPDNEPKKVYLDRPFVYMLIDCENNIPFFIGTVMNIVS